MSSVSMRLYRDFPLMEIIDFQRFKKANPALNCFTIGTDHDDPNHSQITWRNCIKCLRVKLKNPNFVFVLLVCAAFFLSTNNNSACRMTCHDYTRLKMGFLPLHFGICRSLTLCIKISNPLSRFSRIHACDCISLIRIPLQCDKQESRMRADDESGMK